MFPLNFSKLPAETLSLLLNPELDFSHLYRV